MKVRHDARGAASVHGACARSRDASAQRTVVSTTTSVIAVGVAPLMVNNARRLSNMIGGEKGINGFVLDPFQPLSGTKTATQIPSWKVSRSLFVKGICRIAHSCGIDSTQDTWAPNQTSPTHTAQHHDGYNVQRAPTGRQAPHSIHIHNVRGAGHSCCLAVHTTGAAQSGTTGSIIPSGIRQQQHSVAPPRQPVLA